MFTNSYVVQQIARQRLSEAMRRARVEHHRVRHSRHRPSWKPTW